jgi:hypothetical protein
MQTSAGAAQYFTPLLVLLSQLIEFFHLFEVFRKIEEYIFSTFFMHILFLAEVFFDNVNLTCYDYFFCDLGCLLKQNLF